MADDPFEMLAHLEVRQPPPEFDRQLHERLNRALLIQHTVDFLLHALPWAVGHFARAMAAAVLYTLSGRFPEEKR
jgi:hypothetical protein